MRMLILATLMLISGNAVSSEQKHDRHSQQIKFNKTGIASWYGYNHAGKLTASGSRFNPANMTAAHKFLKFGTKLKVTNLKNNKSVVVTITDRGPYIKGRSIDLSKGAAKRIGILGVANVKMEKV